MSRPRPRAVFVRGLFSFVAVLLATLAIATLVSGRVEASTPPDSSPSPAVSTPAAAADEAAPASVGAAGAAIAGNEFLPERENVSECFGALERPNCGSKAKGGWRQTLVFGVIAAGLAVIGWRIVVSVRKRDRAVNAT